MNGNVNNWAEKESQTIDFGSKRLEKQFLKVISDLAQEPEKSIWLLSGSRTNAKAAYHMIGNKEFTKENILAAHRNATNTQNNTIHNARVAAIYEYVTGKSKDGLFLLAMRMTQLCTLL